MKLTDSISRQIREVEQVDGRVTLYSCGPTVYDHAHIGNLRTFILDDTLRRALSTGHGQKFRAVMNITDIDDKTIGRAREEHPELPTQEALGLTTRHYEDLFLNDLEKVGVDLSLVNIVRATDQIEGMQALIKHIYKNGFAYVSEDSVYFDLAAYRKAAHKYGRLVSVDYEAQARIDNDDYDKQNAQDFVLWKAKKGDEPSWDFELDGQGMPGRPGWHIECSAMAADNLGLPLSLHSGGVDLKFPHHENELAQTEAAEGRPLTQAFVHYGHLFVDGRKMSKSLGNFYRLQDIVDHGYHPLAFRLLVLQERYEGELNFTWEKLDQATQNLLDLNAWADLQFQGLISSTDIYDQALATVQLSIKHNMNTVAATAEVLQLASAESPDSASIKNIVGKLDQLLGLRLSRRIDITSEQRQLIVKREAARQAKNFTASDTIRDQLAEQGIAIDDTPAGPRWRRTSI
jgi:cysteinyl-tRNA synthetase